jgi:hypothetical protein
MNQTNNIDDMLKQIMSEKNKLEKLTKKVIPKTDIRDKNYKIKNLTDFKNNDINNDINNANTNSHTKKLLQMGKNAVAKMGNDIKIDKIYGIDINGNSSDGTNTNAHTNTHIKLPSKVKTHKITKSNEVNVRKLLNIPESEFKNSSQEKIKEILDLLQNYIKMDKTYLIKHEELKKLYQEYENLYNKKKGVQNNTTTGHKGILTISKINSNGRIGNPGNPEEDKKHQDMLKSIHSEMKDNNTNLYKQRLMILKKIKDEPHIEPTVKNKICGGLLAIFKSPPKAEYSQFPMLKQDEEKITVGELDNAYLQKHNELMTVYKAYQNLFNKVLHYKDELDKYKKLPTGSLISRNHMDKLVADQGFVMNMIDKMQDQLISQNIISHTDKVPVNPVISNPKNIETFNNTMRDQIKHIIDRQVEVKPNMKMKIENLLSQYKDCDSNDQFCNAGRKLLLIKKM